MGIQNLCITLEPEVDWMATLTSNGGCSGLQVGRLAIRKASNGREVVDGCRFH